MDLRRLFVIVSISIIFITLFCSDTVEGQTDGGQTDGPLPIRCGEEDTESFEVLKECLELPDEEALTCGVGDEPSESCIDGCVGPIIAENSLSMDQLSVNRFNEVRPVMDEIISSCDPQGSSAVNNKLGVGCLKNCEVFFHDCEIKATDKMINGKKRSVFSFGHIENCPNGLLPDETCADKNWQCRSCKSGFGLTGGICKPLPNKLWYVAISICMSIVVLIGFYISLKIIEFQARAAGIGVKRSGVFNQLNSINKI